MTVSARHTGRYYGIGGADKFEISLLIHEFCDGEHLIVYSRTAWKKAVRKRFMKALEKGGMVPFLSKKEVLEECTMVSFSDGQKNCRLELVTQHPAE